MANRYPQDTENRIYLPCSWEGNSLQDLIEEAQRKWFGVDFKKEVIVSCENIQTSGCGCHPESGDYTNYITLERRKK
jgi:hypothetical protein